MINFRINKYIASTGFASRRKAEDLIKAGRVSVNGQMVKDLATKVDPENDEVKIDGNKIIPDNYKYFAFNKPAGVISSTSSDQGKSIVEYLPRDFHFNIVGRLDKDSTGLMILTNDGDLIQTITHPKNEIKKIYILEYLGRPGNMGQPAVEKKFVEGIKKDGEIYKADEAKHIAPKQLQITLHEGKNREIRVIAGKIGLEVKSLTRVQIGKLRLKELGIRPGKYLEISKSDIL